MNINHHRRIINATALLFTASITPLGSLATDLPRDAMEEKQTASVIASESEATFQSAKSLGIQIAEREAIARKKGMTDQEAAELAIKYQELARKKREYLASRRKTGAAVTDLQERLAKLKTPGARLQAIDEHIAMTRVMSLEPTQAK